MGTLRALRIARGWIIGLVAIALLTTGMAARGLVATGSVGAGAVVPVDALALNIAYLADPLRPQLDLAAVRQAGVSVTNSAAELMTLGEHADGVMIDSTMLAAIDRDWLVAQHAARQLVVGVNVPFDQLAAATGSTISTGPGYVQEWPGRTFYSLLWQVEQGGRLRQSTGSDVVRDTVVLLGVVDFSLNQLRAARADLATTRPAPSGAPTRPSTR